MRVLNLTSYLKATRIAAPEQLIGVYQQPLDLQFILYFVVGLGREGCVCAHFCVTAVLSQFQHSTTFFSLISGSPCAGLSKKTKDVEEKKRKQDEDAAD